MAVLHFNAVYLAAEKGEKMYSQLADSLWEVARRKTRFTWTQEMDNNFPKVKKRLSSDRVMVPYKVGRPTRQDCDLSPLGTPAMVSQLYK